LRAKRGNPVNQKCLYEQEHLDCHVAALLAMTVFLVPGSGEWGMGKPHEQLEAWKIAMQLAAMPDFIKPDHTAFDLTDRTGKLLTGLHKKWNTQ